MSTNTNDPRTPTTASSSDSHTQEESTDELSSSAPDPSTTSEPTEEPEAPAEAEEATEDEGDDSSRERREAKRYRLRLREAEAERDAATAKLNSLADRVLSDQLQSHGIGIEALRSAGHDPASFFTDDGTYDPEAVDEAARATAEKFGISRPKAPPKRYSGTGPEKTPTTGWADVLRG